jgi:hypothetical protein
MGNRCLSALCIAGLQILILAGCQTVSRPAPDATASRRSEDQSLTLVVSQLSMHLRDDTYRLPRHSIEAGWNVFEAALWRLERLKRSRMSDRPGLDDIDVVIEYARGRALERVRRYREAASAYELVADTESSLARPAAEAAAVMRRFTAHSGPLEGLDEHAGGTREGIHERVATWQSLTAEFSGTSYEPLAREEAEAWEMVRVDLIARAGPLEAAIAACRQLVERNAESKLVAKHLIRLGDLYAEAARQEQLRSRAGLGLIDAAKYDQLVADAFASYELAAEERRPALRREATTKIEALLAHHAGVRTRAR